MLIFLLLNGASVDQQHRLDGFVRMQKVLEGVISVIDLLDLSARDFDTIICGAYYGASLCLCKYELILYSMMQDNALKNLLNSRLACDTQNKFFCFLSIWQRPPKHHFPHGP